MGRNNMITKQAIEKYFKKADSIGINITDEQREQIELFRQELFAEDD